MIGRPAVFVAGLAMGLIVGFGAGVLSVEKARDFVANAFESERGADVDHPREIVRPAFKLQHPGNWHVDTKDSDYEADHQFSIDSPGQSFVRFVIVDAEIALSTTVEAMVNSITAKLMSNATRTPFHHWGVYDGQGVALAGTNFGIAATMRVFSFHAGGHTVTVFESTFDDDRARVSPGFALVERTLQVTAASEP